MNNLAREIVLATAAVIAFALIIQFRPDTLAGLLALVLPLLFATIAVASICLSVFDPRPATSANIRHRLSNYSIDAGFWLFLFAVLVALQLVHVWALGSDNFSLVSGLLPRADAMGYASGADHLLQTGELWPYSARWPLMTGYLAGLFVLSGDNLQYTVTLTGLVATVACALLLAEIRRIQGVGVALWTLVLLFYFYNGFIGTTMPENLGLTLGACATACLLRSASERSILLYGGGMLLLTLAQFSRVGAALVLPMLLLWGPLALGGSTGKRLNTMLVGIAAVTCGWVVNLSLYWITGTSTASSMGNFAEILYGLSTGTDYLQIFVDYPETRNLDQAARFDRMYEMAWQNIQRAPMVLVSGLWAGLNAYLVDNGGLNMIAGPKAWVWVQIPTIAGLWVCIRQIKNPVNSLVLCVFVGVLLSASIIVVYAGLRVFAATVPFTAVLAAMGLTIFRSTPDDTDDGAARAFAPAALILGAIVVSISLLAPLYAVVKPRLQDTDIHCAPGQRGIYVSYPKRRSLEIISDEAADRSYVPRVRISDLRASLAGIERNWPELGQVTLPVAVLSHQTWILLPQSTIETDPEMILACTRALGSLLWAQSVHPQNSGR